MLSGGQSVQKYFFTPPQKTKFECALLPGPVPQSALFFLVCIRGKGLRRTLIFHMLQHHNCSSARCHCKLILPHKHASSSMQVVLVHIVDI